MLPTLSNAFATLLNIANKTHPVIDTSVLEGHSFCLAIDELPQDIAIRIDNERVLVLDEAEVPDVTISGSLKAVLYMIANEQDGLENDDLYISGKISTARQFQHFLSGFSLDWQAFFAQFMSDDNASKTAEALEQGLHAAKGGVDELKAGLKRYLIDEKKLLVARPELDKLAAEITRLHERLDQLLTQVDDQLNNQSS